MAADPQSSTDSNARAAVFATATLFLTSCWMALSLRIWVRVAMMKSFGWDDATLLFSALLFTGYCLVVILIETSGGASRIPTLTFSELQQLINYVIASFALYLTSMIVFKISLGIFYLRLVIRPWHCYVVHGAIIISTAMGCILLFIAIFNCGNPALYLQNELQGICLPLHVLLGIQYTGAAINAATDWTFAILPIFLLFKADMPKAAKVSAGFVLLMGCCGSVVSLVRIHWIKGLAPGPDFFNTAVVTAIWSIVELGLGITAAATATLRPLFRGLMEQARSRGLASGGSLGNIPKSALGSSNETRHSDPPFGDWHSPVPQHELHDLESQTIRTTSGAQSSKTYSSVTPVLKNSRIMSKMGINQDMVRQQSKRNSHIGRAQSVAKEKSQRVKARMSQVIKKPAETMITETPDKTKRSDITRTQSSRDKLISRPIPHMKSQVAPPTPTFGQRRQQLFRVDPRRNGSSDWVPTVNTSELGSPASSTYTRDPATRRIHCKTNSSGVLSGASPTFLDSLTRSERFPPQANARYVRARDSFLYSPTVSEGRPF